MRPLTSRVLRPHAGSGATGGPAQRREQSSEPAWDQRLWLGYAHVPCLPGSRGSYGHRGKLIVVVVVVVLKSREHQADEEAGGQMRWAGSRRGLSELRSRSTRTSNELRVCDAPPSLGCSASSSSSLDSIIFIAL